MKTLKDSYEAGCAGALAHFKLANMMQGAAGYNPMLSGQAATNHAPPATAAAPAPASPAIAAGAPKAKALG
jgi:hypothetical protein